MKLGLFFFANLSNFGQISSSQQAEKDAILHLNSTMGRFRTLGISRFQFDRFCRFAKVQMS